MSLSGYKSKETMIHGQIRVFIWQLLTGQVCPWLFLFVMSLSHSLFTPVSVTHQEHINHVSCPAQTAAQVEAAAARTPGMDMDPAGCKGQTSSLKRTLRCQKLPRGGGGRKRKKRYVKTGLLNKRTVITNHFSNKSLLFYSLFETLNGRTLGWFKGLKVTKIS